MNNEWDPFGIVTDSGKGAYENPGSDEAIICDIGQPIKQ